MAEITKQALKVDNNSSFPNNNAGAITPAILRAFNVNMIDSMVDEIGYNVDSASWNSSISQLNAFSASAQSLTTASLLITASAQANSNVITFTKGNGSTFNVTVATGSIPDISNLNQATASLQAFTASAQVSINNLNTTTASLNTSVTNINTFTASTAISITNLNASSASQQVSIDSINAKTGSFATTGSNTFTAANTFTSISASSFVSASQFVGDGSKLTGITSSISMPILDEGVPQGNAVSLNFTGSAISAIVAGGVAIISVQGLDTSSFNAYTASTNSSITQLNANTASQQVSIDNLNLYTSSFNVNTLVTTASFNSYTSSNNQRVSSLETNSASVNTSISALNTYTASQSTASLVTSITELNTFSASALVSISNLNASSASQQISIDNLNTNSASVNTSVTNLNSATASLFTSVSALNTFTASQSTASLVTSITELNTFSASALISISNLNTNSASVNTSVTNLNSATASLFTSASLALITASFDNGTRNLTFTKGNNTTFAVNIPDVSGSTGNFATTGSNTFVGNQTITGSINISGSINMVNGADLVTHHVRAQGSNGLELQTSAGTIIVAMGQGGGTQAGFVGALSANSFSSSTINGLGDPLAFSTSVDSRLDNLEGITGSFTTTASFNAYTSSTNGRLNNIETTTASLLIETANLETFSASALISISNLNTATASLNTFTSSVVLLNANNIITGSQIMSGSLKITGSAFGNVISMSIASNTASMDLNTGNYFTLSLPSGSSTRISPTNIQAGTSATLVITTLSGSLVTFDSSVKQPSGSAYVPTSGSIDILSFVSVNSSSLFVVSTLNMI